MLQHRSLVYSNALSFVSGEYLVISQCDDNAGDNEPNTLLNAVEISTGSLAYMLPSCVMRRNLRIVDTPTCLVKYDYLFGQFVFNDKRSSDMIGKFRKNPPTGTYIGCSCVSDKRDGMFFYAYGSMGASDDVVPQNSPLHTIQAVLIAEDKVSNPMNLVVDYKNSGFNERPQGRIVSMHCHPTQQFLFVVYSLGQVQVWSYSACLKHLQQELCEGGEGGVAGGGLGGDEGEAAAGGGGGEGGEGGEEDEGDDVDDAATNAEGEMSGGGRKPNALARGTVSKKMKEQMLKAVAYFALPNASQLMRLDPEYKNLVLSPSSFRLDSRGRFAAVVWSERLLCVYDIYTLLILNLLHKPQVKSQGGTAPLPVAHVIQLSIFGAFPCRALPNAAGIEYNFGPFCFHHTTETVMLTVLRFKRVARDASSSTINDTIRMPLSPVVFAVSLRVHQAILSAIGCYDIGDDTRISNGSAGSAIRRFGSELDCSINWRPTSVDCTPFTGMLVVGFQSTSVLSRSIEKVDEKESNTSSGEGDVVQIKETSIGLDDAPAVEDINKDSPSGAWRNAVASDNSAAMVPTGATQHNPARATKAYQKTSTFFHVYSLDLSWLRETGLSFLTTPIFSTFPVAPDCFTHGEGVLSTRAVYALKPETKTNTFNGTIGGIGVTNNIRNKTIKEFMLVDKGPAVVSPHEEMSDCFPLLLMLRPGLDGANDGPGVNSAALSFHLFRTHWVFPSLRSSSAGKNSEGTTATHIGKISARLTEPNLEASHESSRSWLVLNDNEHMLSLVKWDNDSDVLMEGMQVEHSVLPVSLISTESVGVNSITTASSDWGAMIVGVVNRTISSNTIYNIRDSKSIIDAAADQRLPCVMFVKFCDGTADIKPELSVAYTNFRDAAYWVRVQGTPIALGALSASNSSDTTSSAAVKVGVLALDKSGKRLLHLYPSNSLAASIPDAAADNMSNSSSASSNKDKLRQVATWPLSIAMDRVWTAPAGAPDVVILSGRVGSAHQRQTVYATPANPTALHFLAIGSKRALSLTLRPRERLIEVSWQPLPSANNTASNTSCGLAEEVVAMLKEFHRVWLQSDGKPLVALRTTQRVMICTSALDVLSETAFCFVSSTSSKGEQEAPLVTSDYRSAQFLNRLRGKSKSNATSTAESLVPSRVDDPALCLNWIGAAVTYMCESGCVRFLLPGSPVAEQEIDPVSSTVSFINVGLHCRSVARPSPVGVGLRSTSTDLMRGLLCSLPRNLSTTIPGSQRVLAVLSDRMIISYLRKDGCFRGVTSLPMVAFTQRPLNPLEPLALGMLSLECGVEGTSHSGRLPVISTLVTQYVSPPRDAVTAGAGVGSNPSTQITPRLTLALSMFRPKPSSIPATVESESSIPSPTPKPEENEEMDPQAEASLIAAFATGARSKGNQSVSTSDFPEARWIPSAFKHQLLMQARLHKLAAMELLSVRPELQEMLLDSNAYGGSFLPHRNSVLSGQLVHTAILLFIQSVTASGGPAASATPATGKAFRELMEHQSALAHRLLDIAGDYATLASMLFTESVIQADEAVASVQREAAVAAMEETAKHDSDGYRSVQALLHKLKELNPTKELPVKSVSEIMRVTQQTSISKSSLGGTARPKHITVGGRVGEIRDINDAYAKKLLSLESLQKEHAQRTFHQQGPPPVLLSPGAFGVALANVPGSLPVLGPRSTGLLAKDLLEDFMGVNLQLELCSVTAEDVLSEGGASGGGGGGIGGGGGSGVEGSAGVGSGGTYMGLPLPEGWVEGVGSGGKEHELLSGYWRFSDVYFPSEEGFHCTSLSPLGSRLTFVDLSRFDGPGLELFCADQTSMKIEYSTSPVDPGEKHENVKSLCDVLFCAEQYPHLTQQRGLRCLVKRGSQLDIGVFHTDTHRSKMTIEMMVCFDETISEGSVPTGEEVLLQRCVHSVSDDTDEPVPIWSLSVCADGSFCFRFSSSSDSSGDNLLKSASDMISFGSVESGGGSWTHVAVVIDASKAIASLSADGCYVQPPVSVALHVKGECFEASLTAPSISTSKLDTTMLYVGKGLCAGWRLCELRMWADARSIADMDSQRDNYLSMAMKRKRLQLRVKGTKKLFTGFRDIEIPSSGCDLIKMPNAAAEEQGDGGDGEKEGEGASHASASVFAKSPGILAPKSKPLPLLGRSVPKLKPKDDLDDADSLSGASKDKESNSTSVAPAIVAPAAPAAPMTARERRMNMLKSGGVVPSPAPTAVPAAVATGIRPFSQGTTSVSQQRNDAEVITAAKTSKVSFAQFGDSTEKTHSSAAPQTPATVMHTQPPKDAIKHEGTLINRGLMPVKFEEGEEINLPYSSAKPFVMPRCFAECRPPIQSVYIHPNTPAAAEKRLGSEQHRVLASIPIDLMASAESVICTPLSGNSAGGAVLKYRVALVANKSLVVFSTGDAEGVQAKLTAQMSMGPVKLAHWAFISSDMIMMISSTSAFTIRVAPPSSTSTQPSNNSDSIFQPKPVKIFDRCDLKDVARWADRSIYDLQVCSDGWTMLTTGPRFSGRNSVDVEPTLVSLYHSKSGHAVTFAASGGCLRSGPGVQQAILAWENGNDGADRWCATAVELSVIHAYWKKSTAPVAVDCANKLWKQPITLNQLTAAPGNANTDADAHAEVVNDIGMTLQWKLCLPGSVDNAAAAAVKVDYVGASCLDLATDPTLPSIRIATRSLGAILSVDLKAMSVALSAGLVPSECGERPDAAASLSSKQRCLITPTPDVHVWTLGKLLYVLTKKGLLHQCNVGAVAPLHVGSAQLPLPAYSD